MRDSGFRSLVLSLTLILLLGAGSIFSASAANLDDVVRDFAPKAGTLVMPLNGQWLIDQDSKTGVASGDLFSVIQSGASVIHPLTKEVIGRLETVIGVLQVRQIKAGYAYADVLSQQGDLQPGAVIKRYNGLAAKFSAAGDEASVFYTELRQALPHLTWLSEADKTPELLRFVLDNQGLTVFAQGSEVLHRYSLGSLGLVAQQASASSGTVPSASALPVVGVVQPSSSLVRPASASQPTGAILHQAPVQQSGLWRSNPFSGEPVGVEAADFDGDGQIEIALAFRDHIELGRLKDGQYTSLASQKIPAVLTVLSLDGADLDHDGRVELYLGAVRGFELASLVMSVDGSRLSEVAVGLPYLFRTVTLPNEGPVLLAQGMDTYKGLFTGPIFRVARRGGEVSQGGELSVAGVQSLFSFQQVDIAGQYLTAKLFERNLSAHSAAGDRLWKSEPVFGGSEIYYRRPDAGKSLDIDSIPVYFPPRFALADDGTLLVPSHGSSMLGSLLQSYTNGSIVAMRWNGNNLQELWRTQPQSGYLADFRLADADNDGRKELLGAFVFSRKGFVSEGSGALLAFELD